jgi:hypothetical protein
LGRCIPTHDGNMPVLLNVGPVQARPVIRLLLWGTSPQEQSLVLQEERRAPQLGQPLLEASYGVRAAIDGGSWTAPGSPQAWLRQTHRPDLSAADVRDLIQRARQSQHWPDTPDTQWWLATDLSATQLGLSPSACADHLQVPGVQGAVVRLPFGSCTLPGRRPGPSKIVSCTPLSVIGPANTVPNTMVASIDVIVDHEFAEAATDPSKGWRVLVASRCHGEILLEIADVCEFDGYYISAPVYYTRAGWQPSLLEPGPDGQAARCVNPAEPALSAAPTRPWLPQLRGGRG